MQPPAPRGYGGLSVCKCLGPPTCAHTVWETATTFCIVIKADVRQILQGRTRMLTRDLFTINFLFKLRSSLLDIISVTSWLRQMANIWGQKSRCLAENIFIHSISSSTKFNYDKLYSQTTNYSHCHFQRHPAQYQRYHWTRGMASSKIVSRVRKKRILSYWNIISRG